MAWEVSHTRDLWSAARSLMGVGDMIGLPAAAYVNDVLADLPVEDQRGRRFTEHALGWAPP